MLASLLNLFLQNKARLKNQGDGELFLLLLWCPATSVSAVSIAYTLSNKVEDTQQRNFADYKAPAATHVI
jgi:hypothetical protein